MKGYAPDSINLTKKKISTKSNIDINLHPTTNSLRSKHSREKKKKYVIKLEKSIKKLKTIIENKQKKKKEKPTFLSVIKDTLPLKLIDYEEYIFPKQITLEKAENYRLYINYLNKKKALITELSVYDSNNTKPNDDICGLDFIPKEISNIFLHYLKHLIKITKNMYEIKKLNFNSNNSGD